MIAAFATKAAARACVRVCCVYMKDERTMRMHKRNGRQGGYGLNTSEMNDEWTNLELKAKKNRDMEAKRAQR